MTVTGETGVAGIPPHAQAAGVRLGGRFRLDERINAAGGLSVWKATDALLCRPVAIHLLPPGREVPRHVVEAVQAAARVSDPRLATIYDTDYGIEAPYIVSEWTRGTHLEDLVLSGLPRPALAAAMIADAADAIAVAHEAGRPHLCLSPRCVRWDNSTGLKITGLGIDAALCGADAADPDAADPDAPDPDGTDTRALAGMLYALLTGYWPREQPTALPPAPRHRDRVYTPRQVRAGVPGILDAITSRALRADAPRAVLTPAGLAMALRSVQRPSQPPMRPADGCAPRPAPGRRARTRPGIRHRTTLLRPAA